MVIKSVSRTLLAAFTLLLTATHCVEIDDRDLDPHAADDGGGGSGGNLACQRDADDAACDICVKQNCCAELTTCATNVECQGFGNCIFDCGTTDACVDLCTNDYPGGALDFADYLLCTSDFCTAECSDGA